MTIPTDRPSTPDFAAGKRDGSSLLPPDCPLPHVSPTRCHYDRERTEAAFWERVQQTDGCWEWTGAKVMGYGNIRIARASVYAHRFVYDVYVGPIPDGYQIDHLCRNRACVNPAHLEPVSQGENVRREMAAITHCPRGHEYTGANTYRRRDGSRRCKACVNAANRLDRQRRKGEVLAHAIRARNR